MSSRASASRKHLPGNALSVCLGCAPQLSEPWPQVGWYSPAYALLRVVEQDADDVEQAGEQLQREVEEANPQTCGGGGTAWARQRPMAWPHGMAPRHSRCREGADTAALSCWVIPRGVQHGHPPAQPPPGHPRFVYPCRVYHSFTDRNTGESAAHQPQWMRDKSGSCWVVSPSLNITHEEHGMGRAPSLGCGQCAGGAPSKASPSALPPQPVDRVITQSASEEFITFSLKTSPWARCCATLQHFNEPSGCREERKMWAYELTSGLPPDS